MKLRKKGEEEIRINSSGNVVKKTLARHFRCQFKIQDEANEIEYELITAVEENV